MLRKRFELGRKENRGYPPKNLNCEQKSDVGCRIFFTSVASALGPGLHRRRAAFARLRDLRHGVVYVCASRKHIDTLPFLDDSCPKLADHPPSVKRRGERL